MIIEIYCWLCAAALAVTGSLTFWPVRHWYDFYIPIVLAIAGYLAGFILTFVNYTLICLPISKKKQYNKVSLWARFWFTNAIQYIHLRSHIKIVVKGGEKLPKGQRFLLIGNHRSNYDSLIMSQVFYRQDIAFITKDGNTKIPWGGRLINGLCYLAIDRSNLLQSLSQFKRATELIQNNVCSIGVFPEGTRQHDKVIGDFHEGAFNIAIKGGCPIVIATTKNTHEVKARWPKFTKCVIEIIGVIPWEDIQDKTAKAVSDEVHQIMYDHLAK